MVPVPWELHCCGTTVCASRYPTVPTTKILHPVLIYSFFTARTKSRTHQSYSDSYRIDVDAEHDSVQKGPICRSAASLIHGICLGCFPSTRLENIEYPTEKMTK
jgi:hypothetical protein